MKASFSHIQFQFKHPAGTSRGILKTKNSWILKLQEGNISGKGEISIIEGLSPDFVNLESFEKKIHDLCDNLDRMDWNKNQNFEKTSEFFNLLPTLESNPSIKFGLETALLDLKNGGKGTIFDNDFTKGKKKISINGLIWMGEESFMKDQIDQKLADGFTTLKMKVGAINFDKEIQMLQSIRSKHSSKEITLRVDANGAFSPHQAVRILEQLAELEIHSIEQPIKPGQWNEMRDLCLTTPTPIALDEELIGVNGLVKKIALLETIRPQYIILKPSLHGGISGCQEWIKLAEERNIPWWLTSALESNIGLDAICQFAGEYDTTLPQGLGTGSLYTNNVESNLVVEKGFIYREL